MAEPFKPIGALAINVLAKCAAKKAVIEQLRASNTKLVPHREIVWQTKAYLAEHPELQEQALATAWELSVRDQSGRINAAIFDDDRKGWRKPRRPVLQTDNDARGTENTTEKMQLVSD
jgi:hypothetical protein